MLTTPGRRSRRRTRVMAGLHIVKKPLKAFDRYYVYAWRKGPCIHTQDGYPPIITPEILEKQLKAMAAARKKADGVPFQTIIDAYLTSPDFLKRSQVTRDDYMKWVRRVSDYFGETPVSVFEDRRCRTDIIAWRDMFADYPRTADRLVGMLSRILNFAVDRSMLNTNYAAKVRNLADTNNADEIWEPHHWEQWNSVDIPPQLQDAVFLGSMTGLRLTDLTLVNYEDHVFPNAIKIYTSKGKKRKTRAVIPILPELRDWMKDREHKGTILKNSRGYKWTPSGLGSTFQKQKPEGFERSMHDLRGTFATRLILAGLTDDQTAMIMGWDSKRVAEIRRRYVDEERVIVHLADRLSA